MIHIGFDSLVFLVGGSPKQFDILHHVTELRHCNALEQTCAFFAIFILLKKHQLIEPMTACMLFAYTNINPPTLQNKQKKRGKKNSIESLLTRIYFFIYIKNFYLVFHIRSILNLVYSLHKCVSVFVSIFF